MIDFLDSVLYKRIVFWEPCESPHKADFFFALALLAPSIEVICCANNSLSNDRLSQGWIIKPAYKYKTIVSPSSKEISKLLIEKSNETLHVFSGLRWVPSIVAGLEAVKRNRLPFAIMHEPRAREGLKGKLRFIHSWFTEGWIRKNVEFVLAIGRNGPPWFTSVGYPSERIFPFAYFVNPPLQQHDTKPRKLSCTGATQIGYVGRLVEMKGVFELVAATALLGNSAKLHIVGTGPEDQHLKLFCTQMNVSAAFLGVLSMPEVGQFMNQLDVLVLASNSNDDGWGVVVSEALMCGTAVIATDCVGASIMLEDPLFGRCVTANSPDAISRAIVELRDLGAFSNHMRLMRGTAARKLLSAEAGAKYFLEIVQCRQSGGPRPLAFYKT